MNFARTSCFLFLFSGDLSEVDLIDIHISHVPVSLYTVPVPYATERGPHERLIETQDYPLIRHHKLKEKFRQVSCQYFTRGTSLTDVIHR